MLWKEDIPKIIEKDEAEREIVIELIAGNYKDYRALSPTPDSWAADPNNNVQIWRIKMDPDAEFSIPSIEDDVTRTLYFYEGNKLTLSGNEIKERHLIELYPKEETIIKNGSESTYLLFLQGRPINENLIQYGPFIANSKGEIEEIMDEYRNTNFGGWPWKSSDPVHDENLGRFAKFADGTEIVK